MNIGILYTSCNQASQNIAFNEKEVQMLQCGISRQETEKPCLNSAINWLLILCEQLQMF